MFNSKKLRFAALVVALTVVVTLVLPTMALADGSRKRGRHRDKKAEKFINGHDARDGRFDGRGPNGRKERRIFRDRFDDRRFGDRRFDDRRFDDRRDDRWPRRRRRF